MTPELEDFRQRLITHAKLVVARSSKVESEASTNASLVQPFLVLLGYDIGNPDEVRPEHHADFSDKYQNRVDYAILHDGQAVIAIESKRLGAPLRDDRGQLRSYFNACQTVKLGILTDGLKWEFYADSDKPNLMDETAFLRFDLMEVVADGTINDNTLDGIAAIRSGLFSPENVGAEAKRKLLFESIVDTIKRFKSEPSDDFIRFILGHTTMGGKISKLTQRIVDVNRDIVRSAMEAFVAQEALARFGYAPKDVVRKEPEPVAAITASAEPEPEGVPPTDGTDVEMKAFNYAKTRLFYLVRNEMLFNEVQKIAFRKSKTSFRVYYERPNAGSIFDYKEHRDRVVFQFPALNAEIETQSAEFDDYLLKAFTLRVTEAGIPGVAPPVLHAIEGGAA